MKMPTKPNEEEKRIFFLCFPRYFVTLQPIFRVKTMAKKIFVFLTFVVIIVLVVMALTKPEPWEHQAAVRELAMKVVSQEVASVQLPKEMPAEFAEQVTEKGLDMAMNAAGSFLQSNMQVEDYLVLSVGWVSYHGQTLPITVGTFGRVFVLADENDVRNALR